MFCSTLDGSGQKRRRQAFALATTAIAILSGRASGQVLVVTPSCGAPGSSAHITGSGWAEPNPVCEYRFFFDGTEVAARQPDGLFGPPNRNFVVPAGASEGEHTIKVELRLNDAAATLLQCRQTKFKVVNDVVDPWDGGNNITASGGGISIKFDPKDVCDVTPCKKIVMIQVVQRFGELADGSTRSLTAVEIKLPNGVGKDADTTADGHVVDYVKGEKDPYYNGDDAKDHGQQGVQNGTPSNSTMSDGPGMNNFPSDIVKRMTNFEVGVFCAEGHDKGQFVGRMTWRIERPKGGTQTSTRSSFSRAQPSAKFIAALGKWNTNHKFTLPTSEQPKTGGEPCN